MYADKILEKMKYLKSFKGCFPLDQLPHISTFPSSLIINLDPSNMPGSHWVAIYIDTSKHASYFDSFGQRPPTEIVKWLKQFNSFSWNKKCFQNLLSKSCGYYTIYYIFLKTLGFNVLNFPNELQMLKIINKIV